MLPLFKEKSLEVFKAIVPLIVVVCVLQLTIKVTTANPH